MQKYNPFTPGKIASESLFTGRDEELDRLFHILFQTKCGNPQHFLIHGERGIGKSSLMLYFQHVAEGRRNHKTYPSYHFFTLSIELDPGINYSQLIIRIANELRRKLASEERFKEVLKSTWEFITRWEVLGIKYNNQIIMVPEHELLQDLVETFRKVNPTIQKYYDGILVLIDEADKASDVSNVGEFVKLFTERLSKQGIEHISLGLAGVSSILNKLKQSHESSLRILELLTLNPLNETETINVIRSALSLANERNSEITKITSHSEDMLSIRSDGYPHFVQQFGYCAFDEDSDGIIDEEDVRHSTSKALHQLGLKYFSDLYFDKIGSDNYRKVLQSMSGELDQWVTKEQIRKISKLKGSTLNNAISALKERGIILPKLGHDGIYRLPSKAFAVWINGIIDPQNYGDQEPFYRLPFSQDIKDPFDY